MDLMMKHLLDISEEPIKLKWSLHNALHSMLLKQIEVIAISVFYLYRPDVIINSDKMFFLYRHKNKTEIIPTNEDFFILNRK